MENKDVLKGGEEVPKEVNLDSLMPKPSFFQEKARPKRKDANVIEGFQRFLHDALTEVNRLRMESDRLTQALVTGEVENLHDVMIAAQKAGIVTELTMEIRNAIIRAYDEMMRMR